MRTPSLFVLVSIAVSCAASTGTVRAADDCVAKPNAPAAPGQHWYYRTDRNFKRQCWYLSPQGLSDQNSATETVKQTVPERPETPAASSGAPQPATTGSTGKAGAAAPVPIGFAPATAPGSPDAGRGPDEPPSFQPVSQPPVANARRTAIAQAQALPAYTRPSGTAAATLVVEGNHTFALIMLATVLLAIAGPVIHAARWRRQRKGGDRRELGAVSPSIVSTSDSHAAMTRDLNSQSAARHLPQRSSSRDQTQDVAQTLQRLIDEMETRQ